MVTKVLNVNEYNSTVELRKNIFSVCEKLDKIENPLDDEDFENSISEIDCSIQLLMDLKSTFNDNQYRIDYEISGNSSVEIYVDYDYEFDREENERIYYTYSHPNGSNIISFSKETIRETISDGGDLDSLITDEINDEIRNQY